MSGSYEEEDFSKATDLVGKRRRYFRRPKRPADLLGQLMARKGYAQTDSQDELSEVWYSLISDKFKSKTRITRLHGNVLQVLVSSSAVNQQLGFQKLQLLKQLQQKLPKNKIKDLRFKIGNFG
jgi:predicted nucleic acid-binding Zn ribbon protein